MNTGKGVIGNKERRKSLWFEGKEEFMEEVLSLALKGQLDSDGKKWKVEDFLGMRKRGNEGICNVF